MLVITRKPGQSIHLTGGIVVTILPKNQIGIEAPRSITVLRDELVADANGITPTQLADAVASNLAYERACEDADDAMKNIRLALRGLDCVDASQRHAVDQTRTGDNRLVCGIEFELDPACAQTELLFILCAMRDRLLRNGGKA